MEDVKEVEVTEDALKWDSNVFSKLFNMDITPYVDSIKTGNANLKYLASNFFKSFAPKYPPNIPPTPQSIPVFQSI